MCKLPLSGARRFVAGFFMTTFIFTLAVGCGNNKTDSGKSGTADFADKTAADNKSLTQQLAEEKAGFYKSAPPEAIQIITNGIENIRETGIEKTAITVGDTAPDFTLPDAVGDTVTLSEMLTDGPVVIAWYRGGW